MRLKKTFLSEARKAQCEPDPAYPHGIVVDIGRRPACSILLDYPAPCVGKWLIECDVCGTNVLVTAAGRPDDPRLVWVPCKEKVWA